jgi:hypothetical protein
VTFDDTAPESSTAPSDIVIFFAPGSAQQADARCTLLAHGQPIVDVALRQGAAFIVVAGTEMATHARSVDRPVAIRIIFHEDATSLQIVPRQASPAPELATAFAFDAAECSPGVAVDRIAALPNVSPTLPRGFAGGTSAAGAIDHVSRAGGITGWVVDRSQPSAMAVELRCGDLMLARTIADRSRAATAPHVAEAPLGRFSFPWAEIDRDRLAQCPPDAAIEVIVPTLGGARLDHGYRPVSAGTALDLAGPKLALGITAGGSLIRLDPPRISVVVPNYNYARYLPQRLGSLFAQNAAFELILLDDASTDRSVEVALHIAAAAGREMQIVTSPTNSGAVLPQWRRAAMLARGDYLLIAEADDEADSALLSMLAALLDTHQEMAFAFSDSVQIDADGAVTRHDHKDYYAALGDRALDRDQVLSTSDFLLRFLMPRNLVVNVSAVLWRTAALRSAFERLGPAITDFRAAGDWRVYIEACLAGGTVGYVPAPLNRFRRHDASVVGRYTREEHIAEVEAIHALLLVLCGGEPSVAERLADHRATLRRRWSLPPVMDDAGDTP